MSLNLNVRGLKPSPTLAIQAECEALARQGRRVLRLGLGQSPFPVPEPVVETLRANAHRKEYLDVRGLQALREAVAEYHRRRHGVPCAPDDVLVAPGSKELMFLLQVAYYGELVVPTPAWVSYVPQAQIVGRRVTLLPLAGRADGWRLQPGRLEALCAEDPDRPRILILNYPSNPTGVTFSADELASIAEVARRYRIVVLSDEIYGELHHQGRHVSIARYYPEGTIISGGLSKWCGAGGWRLGTFAFPPAMAPLRDAMAAIASETYTSTSAPIQYAAVRAFQGGLE
ncbi:MAG: pyridoxal phosphate-dependent aminotransferase, partial [Armatimonadota bacterium]|nr:pyridoxal phosphate-dependent aminotransferase [Armatimonadota bacterium]